MICWFKTGSPSGYDALFSRLADNLPPEQLTMTLETRPLTSCYRRRGRIHSRMPCGVVGCTGRGIEAQPSTFWTRVEQPLVTKLPRLPPTPPTPRYNPPINNPFGEDHAGTETDHLSGSFLPWPCSFIYLCSSFPPGTSALQGIEAALIKGSSFVISLCELYIMQGRRDVRVCLCV